MQRTEDLMALLSHPRTIDPALPSDGITEPDGGEAGEDPNRDDDSEETEEIEIGDPRDGP